MLYKANFLDLFHSIKKKYWGAISDNEKQLLPVFTPLRKKMQMVIGITLKVKCRRFVVRDVFQLRLVTLGKAVSFRNGDGFKIMFEDII
jgi:hypothetical protein